jgi:hypothetical protein
VSPKLPGVRTQNRKLVHVESEVAGGSDSKLRTGTR